jgi:hypothetical protein
MLEVPIQSGIVTVGYFIIFDIIVLGIIGYIGTILIGTDARQRVLNGQPLKLAPSRLPVLGYGCYAGRSLRKVMVVCSRATALVALVLINVGTNGSSRPATEVIDRTHLAYPNAADSDWQKNGTYTIQREFNAFLGCSRATPEGMKLFQIALNLEGGGREVQDNDPSGRTESAHYPLVRDSLACLDGITFGPEAVALEVTDCYRGVACRFSPARNAEQSQESRSYTVNLKSSRAGAVSPNAGSRLIGLSSLINRTEAQCVATQSRTYCLMWQAVDTGEVTMWIEGVTGQDSSRLYAAEDGGSIDLSSQRASGIVTVKGGRYGSITIGQAMVAAASARIPDILHVIANIYSQSVEYRMNPNQLYAVKSTVNVTVVGKAAIAGLACLGMIMVLSIIVLASDIIAGRSLPISFWKLSATETGTVWASDGQSAGQSCGTSTEYPVVQLSDYGSCYHLGKSDGSHNPAAWDGVRPVEGRAGPAPEFVKSAQIESRRPI